MSNRLPWGWLNAAATSEQIIDDTVIAVKINAMEAHWDDVVPCNIMLDRQCSRMAVWSWYCSCGEPYLTCHPHREEMDHDNASWELTCMRCDGDIPEHIPWLPL